MAIDKFCHGHQKFRMSFRMWPFDPPVLVTCFSYDTAILDIQPTYRDVPSTTYVLTRTPPSHYVDVRTTYRNFLRMLFI